MKDENSLKPEQMLSSQLIPMGHNSTRETTEYYLPMTKIVSFTLSKKEDIGLSKESDDE